MKDFLKNDVKINDNVVFLKKTYGYQKISEANLSLGKVIKFRSNETVAVVEDIKTKKVKYLDGQNIIVIA